MQDTNQTTVEIGKLYRSQSMGESLSVQGITPSVWVNSGSVDMHGSDSATVPADVASMTLNTDDTGIDGKREIHTLANYISFTQNEGATTELVLTGVFVEDLGDIS